MSNPLSQIQNRIKSLKVGDIITTNSDSFTVKGSLSDGKIIAKHKLSAWSDKGYILEQEYKLGLDGKLYQMEWVSFDLVSDFTCSPAPLTDRDPDEK